MMNNKKPVKEHPKYFYFRELVPGVAGENILENSTQIQNQKIVKKQHDQKEMIVCLTLS